MEGIICASDEGYAALKDAFVKGEDVDICRFAGDGTAERNWYAITELSDSTPHDDMATFSTTLQGKGAPTFYHGLTSVDEVKATTSDGGSTSGGSGSTSGGSGNE